MEEVKKARKIRVEDKQKEIKYKKNKVNVMKYLLIVFGLVIAVVLICTKTGTLKKYTDEECFTTDGAVIIGYDSSCGMNIKIPSVINGVKITEIGEYAFYELGIESVEFPDTLKKIRKESFRRNNLTKVIIPDSVTKIYAGAFEQNEITNVSFGENVNLIGAWSFDFNHLSVITIPDSVKTINQEAFANNSLITVSIGSNVETIEYSAFGQYDWRNDLISDDSDQNRNLSLIINKTGRAFDWYDVLAHDNVAFGPELWLVSGKVDTEFGTVIIKEQ